jgi:hypothetical protein
MTEVYMAEQNTPEAGVRKVIVAIHGIGDQTQFATIQQTAAQFCSYHESTFATPLGSFHNGLATFALPEHVDSPALRELLFAEVYWADIPRAVVDEGFKLEDAQAWAKTIVGRVRQRDEAGGNEYGEREYSRLELVLSEMGEALGVMGRVFYLSGKMGLFSFDLDRIILDYLDDVQVVADFKEDSGRVIRRFSDKLNDIYKELSLKGERPEIYLVTHSEGTVVGLLGLLSAICGKDPVYGKDRPPWLDCIRGLMTIGSPIDKHLSLWPELFDDLLEPAHQPKNNAFIEWRNYYDLGDPVGFELPLARTVFNTDIKNPQDGNPWRWFNFPEAYDHKFTRSLFPGKAHNDYWTDPAVFGHFIQKVVYQNAQSPQKRADKKFDEPPGNRLLHKIGSWFLPYVAALALLFFAVYTVYKAVKNCLAGNDNEAVETAKQIFLNVGGFTALLAGLTVTARIPRLTREWWWRFFGIVVFALGAFGYMNTFDYMKLISTVKREGLSHLLTSGQHTSGWGLVILASLIAVLANIVARKYPRLGVRPLLWFGGAGVLGVIAKHLYATKGDTDRGAIWPVVMAGALFLYLWWLTILFFDLVFIWHRYIQTSLAQRQLNAISCAAYLKR